MSLFLRYCILLTTCYSLHTSFFTPYGVKRSAGEVFGALGAHEEQVSAFVPLPVPSRWLPLKVMFENVAALLRA